MENLSETMNNSIGTMKNWPAIMNNHKNPPGTMKTHENQQEP